MKKQISIIVALFSCLCMTVQIQGKEISTPIESSVSLIENPDKESSEIKGIEDSTALWVDAQNLRIDGMGWEDQIENYTRLPDKYKSIVTSRVWNLSRQSAGLSVRFTVKGTSSIRARWTLRRNSSMPHMTPLAINGLDLYLKQNEKWIWAGVGKPSPDGLKQESILKTGLDSLKTYECMLYLPLYNGVTSLNIGFSPEAKIETAPPYATKPFVFYGTSILQGCSASRSGMVYTSMLSRKFETPVINLGFSGNGLMEEHFGKIMGEIDASVYFIDCLPNMSRFSSEEITDRTLKLVRELRFLRPGTPIVLIEDRTPAYDNFKNLPENNSRRIGLKAAYDLLINETSNLYYQEGNQLLGDDGEATVDGSHPSDLGMYRYYLALIPLINQLTYHN